MKNIEILAACSDLGLSTSGTQLGPDILINNINKNNIIIKKLSCNNNYKKELDANNKMKNLNELNLFNEQLYCTVKNTLDNNNFPITLGGDHSIAIGSALASINKYNNLGIIWLDAHGDYNTFDTTPSGNIHGLPFAVITGYEKRFLANFHKGNYFNPKNAVLLGARDIDEPYELENIKAAGVTIITTEDIKKYGFNAMYEKAFSIASAGTNGIHISYDVDCIDCDIATGVSTPVKNGINLDEAYGFVDYIIKNKENVTSVDIVEFNPLNDKEKITENIVTNILNKLINNI